MGVGSMSSPTDSPSLAAGERAASAEAEAFANEEWPSGVVLAKRIAVMIGIAAGVGLVLSSSIPVCPVANLTGHPCPGCGLTRATLACVHGQLGEAVHFHPLVFLATPVFGVCVLLAIHSYAKRGKVRFSPRVSRVLTPILKVVYVALIGLWLVRFFGAFGGPVPVSPAIFSRLF